MLEAHFLHHGHRNQHAGASLEAPRGGAEFLTQQLYFRSELSRQRQGSYRKGNLRKSTFPIGLEQEFRSEKLRYHEGIISHLGDFTYRYIQVF